MPKEKMYEFVFSFLHFEFNVNLWARKKCSKRHSKRQTHQILNHRSQHFCCACVSLPPMSARRSYCAPAILATAKVRWTNEFNLFIFLWVFLLFYFCQCSRSGGLFFLLSLAHSSSSHFFVRFHFFPRPHRATTRTFSHRSNPAKEQPSLNENILFLKKWRKHIWKKNFHFWNENYYLFPFVCVRICARFLFTFLFTCIRLSIYAHTNGNTFWAIRCVVLVF